MKKVLLATIVWSLTLAGYAQDDKYTKAMKSGLEQFEKADSPDKMLAVAASFERIGDAEKTKWLPYYYAALCETFYGFMKNEAANNDNYAAKAEQLLAKAENLEKNNSEISCVKSLIASLRMIVNPAERWQQYGQVVTGQIETAKKQDPANPRPYYLEGQSLRYTPEQFGGGCATAKPKLEEAMKKYETFSPVSDLHPNWGKAQVQQMLEGCK